MKLSHLTDTSLHQTLKKLVSQEREILVKLLWHLHEVDKRKLYCEFKCGSLFEYAVKILKYSESQASRRVTACRLFKELPEIAPIIEDGDLNLSQLGQAKKFFADEQISDPKAKRDVLDKIKGKSVKESDKILWDLKKDDTPRKASILLKQETIDYLYEVKALKAHSCPDLDSVIMKMGEEAMKVWVPVGPKRKTNGSKTDTRYVSVGVRAEVWSRDSGKCVNCGSNYAVEFDHIQAFVAGGLTTEENLQLLCRNCNQWKGRGVIKAARFSKV